jgi:isoquinoline 1-oxidoreductase subunit beta
MAAARLTGIAKSKLRTRNGTVVTPDGMSLSYASLAVTAAKIDPPANVATKPESERCHLGKSMRRLDMVAKCTGTAIFGIDLRMSGMVYATVRTNLRLGGGLNSYNDSAAAKAKGVIKIVPITGGVGVIADNTWRAFQAASLFKFEWGPAPYPATTAAMFERVAASFVSGHQDSRLKNEGNIEAALAGANVLEAEYKVPCLAHAPLEPMNVVVELGTQIPMFLVAAAASVAGLRAGDIHLRPDVRRQLRPTPRG